MPLKSTELILFYICGIGIRICPKIFFTHLSGSSETKGSYLQLNKDVKTRVDVGEKGGLQ